MEKKFLLAADTRKIKKGRYEENMRLKFCQIETANIEEETNFLI